MSAMPEEVRQAYADLRTSVRMSKNHGYWKTARQIAALKKVLQTSQYESMNVEQAKKLRWTDRFKAQDVKLILNDSEVIMSLVTIDNKLLFVDTAETGLRYGECFRVLFVMCRGRIRKQGKVKSRPEITMYTTYADLMHKIKG